MSDQRGASELLSEAIGLLRRALADGVPIRPLARQLVDNQPSMASIWTAAAHAVAAEGQPARFERFAEQVAHAPRALARYATSLLLPDDAGSAPMRFVTVSFSASVLHVLDALREHRPLRVACAEGRPALEGRRLATELAAREIPVTCYADGAIASALSTADAVLVGADAITPDWFLNKTGTRLLAAAAAQAGVPLYVVASRDKLLPAAVAARLQISEGPSTEIWDSPPAGVTIRNPYFEPTPLELVSAVITDMGVLGAALVPEACETASVHTLSGGPTTLHADW